MAENILSCDGAVQFTDMSVNEPSAWLWNFGDGNSATSANPLHVYEEEGVYSISLEVCNALGCDDFSLDNYITVDFTSTYCDTLILGNNTAEITEVCNGVLLDNGGNGPYLSQMIDRITIAPPGAVTVSLTFDFIDFETCCDGLRIYDGPNTLSPLIGDFKSTSDLPPGQTVISTGASITVEQYANNFTVFEGFSAYWDCQLAEDAPISDFNYVIVDTCLGIVEFIDETQNYPSTWNWMVEDNTYSTQNIIHQFEQSGTYDITLNTCNVIDCNEITLPFTIDGVLFVDWDVPDYVEVGIPTSFSDNTENAMNWNWNFGNGNVSGVPSPITFYNEIGTYTITLTVATPTCERTVSKIIEVVPVGIHTASKPTCTIYPNPSTGQVQINYPFSEYPNSQLSIHNAVGQKLYHTTANTSNTLHLNLSTYPKGIYFLLIENQAHKSYHKLLLQQ
jgi:PKD repeat protein